MKTNQDSSQTPSADPHAFAGWCALGGAILGAVLGLFFHGWRSWAFGGAAVGLIVGAFIDRSRR